MLIQQGLTLTPDRLSDKDPLQNDLELEGSSFHALISDLQSINTVKLESEKEDEHSEVLSNNAEFLIALNLPPVVNLEKSLIDNDEPDITEIENDLTDNRPIGSDAYRLKFLNTSSPVEVESEKIQFADSIEGLGEYKEIENNNPKLQIIPNTILNKNRLDSNSLFAEKNLPVAIENEGLVTVEDKAFLDTKEIAIRPEANQSKFELKNSSQIVPSTNQENSPNNEIFLSKNQKETANELIENNPDETEGNSLGLVDPLRDSSSKPSYNSERAIEAYSPSKNNSQSNIKDKIPVWDMSIDSASTLDKNSNKAILRINQWGIGEITAKIEVTDHKSMVTLIADTTEVKQALQTHLIELKEFFTDSDLQLGQVNIEQQDFRDQKKEFSGEQQKNTNYKLPENQLEKVRLDRSSPRKQGLLDTYV